MTNKNDAKHLGGYKPATKKASRWDWLDGLFDILTLTWLFDLLD